LNNEIGLLFEAGRCLKLEPFEYLLLTDVTTSLNILFEFQLAARKPRPADKLEKFAERKPRPAGKLMVVAERTPRPADKIEFAEHKSGPADNVKFAECKPRPAVNFFDKVTGTFTIRVQTQHVIRELREDQLNDEQRTRADVKLLFVRAN
jgi:hypothetical protein